MGGEWQRHEVSQLIEEGRLFIGDGYRAKSDELGSVGLPFARAGNINDGFQFGEGDCFPEQSLDRVGNKVGMPGDVVFTSKGTVGRFAFVQTATPRFVYSPQLCFWRSLDQETIHSRFLYYWMFGREFFVQFKGVAGQTDMAEYVSLGDQRCMSLTLPPLSEQRAIAYILGTLDDKIELNRRVNETVESMARALFKSWFVDFDPVHAKAEGRNAGVRKHLADLLPDCFEDSEMDEIPQGWKTCGLDGIARFLNGLALQKFPPTDGESLPVVKIAQLRAGNVLGADEASVDIAPEYIVEDGDVLFSWSGSLECVLWAGGKGALNQHLFKVTSSQYPKWLYYFWIHRHLDNFRQIAAGKATTMGHIQRHHLSDAKVALPPERQLEAFATIFSPMIESLWRRKVQSRTLAEIRDTLLPKLISGELRVKNAERRVEAVL